MSYLKITHDCDLCLYDNDKMKVLCQKLYDKPFRTYVRLKSTEPLKLFRETLRTEDNTLTVRRIRFKELERETKGLSLLSDLSKRRIDMGGRNKSIKT